MNTPRSLRIAIVAGLLLAGGVGHAQQVPDRAFRAPVAMPRFAGDAAPTVCVDEGHNNFHTLSNRFWAFGELLRADGYGLKSLSTRFDAADLSSCRILVIANAQPGDENWDAYPYPTPPAFADVEAIALRRWVESGGALLLIADHMPFPGAAANVAAAFGFEFNDGFAVEDFRTEAEGRAAFDKPTLFETGNGTLVDHVIVRGSRPEDSVTRIRTFTGQAFRAPASAQPLLRLPANFISLMPEKAWRFSLQTPRVAVGGWLQGAVMPVGRGRLGVFGEAGMFTAQVQLSGGQRQPMGMNAPHAEQNYRFILNLMRWLLADLG